MLRRTQRLWVISALLVALVVRALIPAGFMPATDRPFSFQICPDGLPAELMQELMGTAPGAPAHEGGDTAATAARASLAATSPADGSAALAHHHHDGMQPAADGSAPVPPSGDRDGLAHGVNDHGDGSAGSSPGSSHPSVGALAHAGHHHSGDLFAHDHSTPAHNHSSASAEHCVFAAAAGVFALAFAATLFAPATILAAPDVPYVSPVFESHRFTLAQPRGPPALS